jgi:hypothetical protein
VAYRTTADLVKKVLGDDYGPRANGSYPSLDPFILTANLITSRVVTCARNKGEPLDSTTAELLERILSAHYYTKNDRIYSSRSTSGASGSFVLGREEPEPYKAWALDIDPSGCLSAIFKSARASIAWLGKTTNEALTYEERNGGGY